MESIRIHLTPTNVYLLPCNDGYLLIDASYPESLGRFKTELAKRGISLSDIKHILLTHHHDDHAGFLEELRRECPSRLILHREAVGQVKKGENKKSIRPVNRRVAALFFLLTLLKRGNSYPPVTVGEDDLVIEKEAECSLSEIGIPGKIVPTPGHTSDSISLIMDDGDAFVGDAASNLPPFLGLKHRPIVIESMREVLQSWDRLIKDEVKTIFPSHGDPFGMDKLRALQKPGTAFATVSS